MPAGTPGDDLVDAHDPLRPATYPGDAVPSAVDRRARPATVPGAPYASPLLLPPPAGGIVDARAAVTRVVADLGPALGNVFLVPHPWIGLLLWLALAWDPRHAAFGMLGLGVAIGGMRMLGIGDEHRAGGGLKANALLTAIAVSWMTAPTGYALHTQIGMAVVAAAVAFVIAAGLIRVMGKSDFPTLLWGYCLVAGTIFTIFPIGTLMASRGTSWWWTPPVTELQWAADFFRSIGSLLFSPTLPSGIIIACAILLWSRAALLAGIVGWIAGACVALGIQDLGVTYYWLPAAHNYFVAGMAIGAGFVLPSHSSLLLAALAGAAASLVAVALQHFLPAFAYLPIASGLTVWCWMAMLALAGARRGFWRNRSPDVVPEEAWWRETHWSQRLGRGEPLLVVPLSGVVQITQGFGGSLSHFGNYRHALDFQRPQPRITDLAPGESIWRAPVTAPAAGVVERVVNDVPDNPLGICNYAENWGNFVCIRLDQGGYALLAHLQQGSITTSPGMRLEIGSHLGSVGNSGRSPVPHLHLQVQAAPDLGAPTIPFRLANYRSGWSAPLLDWSAADIPTEKILVMAAAPAPAVHALLAGLAPGTAVWAIDSQGIVPRAFRTPSSKPSLRVEVRLDERGRHRMSCGSSSLILSLDADGWRAFEQRGSTAFLKLLAIVAPSIPYAATTGTSWADTVPAVPAGIERWTKLPLAPYRSRPFLHTRTTCTKEPYLQSGTLVVETQVGPRRRSLPTKVTCTFEPLRGPVSVEATFEHGKVVYSLMSFDPTSPYIVPTVR